MVIPKFSIVTSVLNAVGACFVLFIMVIMTLDVGGRVIFNNPLVGVPEMVTMSIAAIVFLQLPHAVASGKIIRSDMWIQSVSRKHPRTVAVLDALYDVVGLCVFAIVLYATVPFAIESYINNDQYGTPGIFLFPKWPLRVVISLGCAAAIIQFGINIYCHMRSACSAVKADNSSKGIY